MPLILTHKAFTTQDTIFKGADEVPVACIATSTASTASLVGRIRVDVAIGRWWIVCWTGLQPNWCIRVEMTGNSLDGGRNTLRVHSGCTLATSSGGCLCVKTLGRSILRLRHLPWHEVHLMTVARRLRGIRRRCLLIHSVVHRRGLHMRLWVVLVHLHGVGCLGCRLCMRRPLLTRVFGCLLLLNSRRNSLVERGILQVHRWYEGSGELLLCDERMQLGLLR